MEPNDNIQFQDVSPTTTTPTPVAETPVAEETILTFVNEVTPATEEPAEAPVVDEELEQALTDLSVAARVLSNIANAINVVLSRADSTGLATVATAPVVTDTTPPPPLSERDTTILNLLARNNGRVVSKTQFRRTLGGRTGDLTSAVSRLRRHGFRIESTQTIRANGERIGKNITGYRMTTDEQVRARDAANLMRGVLRDVLTSI